MAEVVIKSQDKDEARVANVAQRILLRPLSAAENTIVQESYRRLLTHYRAHEDDAKQLLKVGEKKPVEQLPPADVAALTMLCNQLLNLDEVLNK
jgi:hypothetical protein